MQKMADPVVAEAVTRGGPQVNLILPAKAMLAGTVQALAAVVAAVLVWQAVWPVLIATAEMVCNPR